MNHPRFFSFSSLSVCLDPWEGDIRGRLDSPATESTDPWGDLTSAPSGSPALKPVNLTDEIVM